MCSRLGHQVGRQRSQTSWVHAECDGTGRPGPGPGVVDSDLGPVLPIPSSIMHVKDLMLVGADTSSCVSRLHLQRWTVLGQDGDGMHSEIMVGPGRRDLRKRQLQT